MQRVRRGATFLGAIFCLAVAAHHWLSGEPWLESVYWVVITLSGVGYSQEVPESVGPALQLKTIFVILIGMVALGYTLGVLFQAVIEGQLERAFGVRRMTRQIEQLKDHVIVCGFGRLGHILAERLAAKKLPFVAIDADADAVAEAVALGYLAIEGDATDESVLQEANIKFARIIVVALHSDADNVFLTLTARNLNPQLHIFARGEQVSTEKKLRQAGANHVVTPAAIGAQRIGDMILKPHAADLMYRVADHTTLSIELEELLITESNPLVGQTIREADPRQRHQVLIVGIRPVDGDLMLNPAADHEFQTGDMLIVLGEPDQITKFRREQRFL